MDTITMDYPLTLMAIMRRAEQLFGHKQIVTRQPDRSFCRHTYGEVIERSKRLALALERLGIHPGDRVGTLLWNTHQHLEAYFGVPAARAVVHTINPRLPLAQLVHIVREAEDRVLLVDASLLSIAQALVAQHRGTPPRVVLVSGSGAGQDGVLDYEELLAGERVQDFRYPQTDEWAAAAMCYSSGTTGLPKGVLYSHRALVLHSLTTALPDVLSVGEADVVLPVVPMFHVNAWGLPFTAAMVGAKQVLPGPHLDPESLLEDFAREGVSVTAGVPTIWLGLLQHLDGHPHAYDLSHMRSLIVGGAAAPQAMIRGFSERHGLTVVQGWGMTETAPIGLLSRPPSAAAQLSEEERYAERAKQGAPLPFFEVRARAADGMAPWDGKTQGELEVRGAWVAGGYHRGVGREAFTEDGWFRTGDIVSIDTRGVVELHDRARDLIKSGGEWISSVALEGALMNHPAVAEAAVIAAPHPKWQERPLAIVVLRPGRTATPAELTSAIADRFPGWWLPDAYLFVEEIPHTATGKPLKAELRARYGSGRGEGNKTGSDR